MALISCPECGKQVSTEATNCPACGYPVAERVRNDPGIANANQKPDLQTVLLEVRPSWWNFFWHFFFFFLIVPPIIAWYRRHSFAMRIYPDRISISEGFLAKEGSEFFIKDVRAIDVKQGVWGRMFNIGDVTISTAATIDAAEVARGVPDPNGIKDLLITQRQKFKA